jgi:hypothetical protein
MNNRRKSPVSLIWLLVGLVLLVAFGGLYTLNLWIAEKDQGQWADSPPTEVVDVTGTVMLSGAAPPREKFDVHLYGGALAKAYPSGLFVEPVLVDSENRVQGCLVYVKKGLEGRKFIPPKRPKRVVFDQYLLRPRIMGIMIGQDLTIESHDADIHNAHFLPIENKETNTGLPRGEKFARTFTKPEIGIKLKCDCHHDWERTWITVLDHPFYAITDQHGQFELRGLPPGKYAIEAWQENCEPVTQEIELLAKSSMTTQFRLKAKSP